MTIAFSNYKRLPEMPVLPPGTFKLRVHPDLYFQLKKATLVNEPLFGITIESDLCFPFYTMLAYVQDPTAPDMRSLQILTLEMRDDESLSTPL